MDRKPSRDKILPELIHGECLIPGEVRISTDRTRPEPLYTEASLLGAMETAGNELKDQNQREAMKKGGLGTPATRAGMIEVFLERHYIERKDRTLIPTRKGLEVYRIVKDKRIADVEMTGMWEAALRRIESGEMSPISFKNSIETYARQIVKELLETKIERPVYPQCRCPRCSGTVFLYNKVAKCSNPECALFIRRTIGGTTLTDDLLFLVLSGESTPYLEFVSKNGQPYRASISLNDEYIVEMTLEDKQNTTDET